MASQQPIEEAATPRWHVIAVKAKRETWAAQNLRANGHEVYLPLRLATTMWGIQNGKRVKLAREAIYSTPLFPGYLFVRIQSAKEWASIFTTWGVQSVIGTRERPAAVRKGVIEGLKATEEKGLIRLETAEELSQRVANMAQGDQVKVAMGGVLGELAAIFDAEVDDERCAVLLSLCGSDSRRVVLDKARVRT